MDGFSASQVSSIIGFDISTLTIASLIVNIIIPFIVVWYAMYLLLCKIRIFRNTAINSVIGAFMSFLAIRLSSTLAMWLGFAGILAIKFNNLYDKALALVIFAIMLTQITALFSIHGALSIFCLLISLICIFKIPNRVIKTIAVIIIFVAYYFLSPYAAVADTQFKLRI